MNRRLENLYSHLPERVAQVAVSQGNAATYGIGICVVAWIIRLFTQFLGHHEIAARLGAFCLWCLGAAYHDTQKPFSLIPLLAKRIFYQ